MKVVATWHASTDTRRIAPWIGFALLALWLGWLLPVFHTLLIPATPSEDAATIVARLQAYTPAARDLARTTIFLASSGSCRCQRDTSASGLRNALRRTDTSVELLNTSGDTGYPVVVIAPPARLVYAGPAHVDTGCGPPIALAALLPMLLSASRQALIVPSTCPCSKES
jgi:hypothetical protein